MLKLTIALCGVIAPLFLIFIFSVLLKWEKVRLIIGIMMSIISAIAMVLFIYAQRINGNPDAGMEFIQFYFPLLVFVFFMAIGILPVVNQPRKQIN